MKRTLMATGVAVAFSAALAFAQTPSSTDQSSSKSSKHQRSSREEVTLTGCLQQGSTPNTYLLTNVQQETTGTSGQSASSSSQSSTSGSSSSESVELLAGRRTNLKEHVGHKIEVKGYPAGMEEPGSQSGSSSSSSGTSGQSSTSGSGQSGSMSGMSGSQSSSSTTPEHRVRVSSVKMISSSCS